MAWIPETQTGYEYSSLASYRTQVILLGGRSKVIIWRDGLTKCSGLASDLKTSLNYPKLFDLSIVKPAQTYSFYFKIVCDTNQTTKNKHESATLLHLEKTSNKIATHLFNFSQQVLLWYFLLVIIYIISTKSSDCRDVEEGGLLRSGHRPVVRPAPHE